MMLPKFHTLYLETTRRCNYSCDHCSSGSHLKNAAWGEELSYEHITQSILKPAWELGTRYIEFSGGEFLLRKDAFDLLSFAHNTGFRIGIASNGALLNAATRARLRALLGDNLLISLGINSFEDAENAATRTAGADSLLELIHLLEQESINVNICVTLGKHTAGQVNETIEKIRELGLPLNRIPFIPRHSEATCLMFDRETLQQKLHPALRSYFKGYVSFVPFFIDPEQYARISGQREETCQVPTNPSIGCWCGSFYAINPEGEVSPCPLLGDHLSGGNVTKTPLKEILFQTELFRKIIRRNEFGGKCGKCRFRFTCGGCRTMAYYQTGDVFGADPTCFIDELSAEELETMEKEMLRNFNNYVRMCHFGGLYKEPGLPKD